MGRDPPGAALDARHLHLGPELQHPPSSACSRARSTRRTLSPRGACRRRPGRGPARGRQRTPPAARATERAVAEAPSSSSGEVSPQPARGASASPTVELIRRSRCLGTAATSTSSGHSWRMRASTPRVAGARSEDPGRCSVLGRRPGAGQARSWVAPNLAARLDGLDRRPGRRSRKPGQVSSASTSRSTQGWTAS
jgi:hypothetical protein